MTRWCIQWEILYTSYVNIAKSRKIIILSLNNMPSINSAKQENTFLCGITIFTFVNEMHCLKFSVELKI